MSKVERSRPNLESLNLLKGNLSPYDSSYWVVGLTIVLHYKKLSYKLWRFSWKRVTAQNPVLSKYFRYLCMLYLQTCCMMTAWRVWYVRRRVWLHLCIFSDLLQDEGVECVICQKTRADLDVVREEFERYKLRAQSVLKNKTTKV